MNGIKLHRTNNGWVAEYTGPHAQRIVQSFGWNMPLPTAYTSEASAIDVIAAISERNPGVLVQLA